MIDWNLRGWIDNESPVWFKLIFWTLYHIYHQDEFEAQQKNIKVKRK